MNMHTVALFEKLGRFIHHLDLKGALPKKWLP